MPTMRLEPSQTDLPIATIIHTMYWEPRRSDPVKAAAEARAAPGGVGSRAAKVLSSFAGAYYFDGIGQAIQGGLWCALPCTGASW